MDSYGFILWLSSLLMHLPFYQKLAAVICSALHRHCHISWRSKFLRTNFCEFLRYTVYTSAGLLVAGLVIRKKKMLPIMERFVRQWNKSEILSCMLVRNGEKSQRVKWPARQFSYKFWWVAWVRQIINCKNCWITRNDAGNAGTFHIFIPIELSNILNFPKSKLKAQFYDESLCGYRSFTF